MKIVSYNVNGLRAALKKGLLEWLAEEQPDVLCLQEVKAMQTDVDLAPFEALGYCCHWFSAEKKGYSGVATFAKQQPEAVFAGDGRAQSDAEGRVIRTDFGDLTVLNCYFPSGTSGDERQAYKYVWLDEFFERVQELRKTRPEVVICGDYNIAHRDVDIHNPKGNAKNSGFLPEERAWMDKLLQSGFTDTYRHHNPDATGGYSWWSTRFPTVRKENKGWRIDYISVSQPLHSRIVNAAILPDAVHSDHCPVLVELGDV